MPKIRLKSINFELPKFRKLGQIQIPIAERITLIAGHNGIGKSTILGLISHTSGFRHPDFKTLTGKAYQTQFSDIIRFDYLHEYLEPKESGKELPSPTLAYEIDNQELVKRCRITARKERKEIRLVSSNEPWQPFITEDGSFKLESDTKVPLPTLYLGMTRILPIGEIMTAMVVTEIDETIHDDDRIFITEFVSKVIDTGIKPSQSTKITTKSVRGTNKITKHPDYAYSTDCISLGQDSLSSIATALASFKKLQREWPDYPGGLLVIDEIDSGLHPHAQKKLLSALTNSAKKLNIQIVATTHSINMISLVHPDNNPIGPGGKHVNGVVYLTDTRNPRITESWPLEQIKQDMNLEPIPDPPKSKIPLLLIYHEDMEAALWMEKLLTRKFKAEIKETTGARTKVIPIEVGSPNLMNLPKHDPYFKSVIIAVDYDQHKLVQKSKYKNIVTLPGGTDSKGNGLNPEQTLHQFITELVITPEKYPYTYQQLQNIRVSSNYLEEHLLNTDRNIGNRVSAKEWMKDKLQEILKLRLIELWNKEHDQEVADFQGQFLKAAAVALQHTK